MKHISGNRAGRYSGAEPRSNPRATRKRWRRRAGFALVITLAALILMTVLLLAFFSRSLLDRQISFSSTNMATADYLARASLDFVVGELRDEIRDPNRSTISASGLYLPTNNAYLPAKMGIAGVDTNGVGLQTLKKVSADGQPIRPDGQVKASAVPITSAGSDARSISTNRWFGSGGPGLGSQNVAPTWFYVTRGNGITTPTVAEAGDRTSPDYVIGRFACTVYEVDGLLDANVAGYPQGTNNPYAGLKSSIAYADLTALNPADFAATAVDQFVTWRDGTTAASAESYDSYQSNFAVRHAFARARQGHNVFLSRKDLLNSTNNTNGGLVPGITPFLTHFSRALNAPSWRPSADSSAMTNYIGGSGTAEVKYLTGETSDSANRSLPEVIFSDSANIIHYDDAGKIEPFSPAETSYSYRVTSGSPLVQRRFSLAKLSWLTPTGPKAGISDQAIEDCFGLKWVPGSGEMAGYWRYVAAGTAPKLHIKTLAEVAADKREPNFFEMLKAGILSGSLGKDPGPKGPFPDGPIGFQFGPEGGNEGYSEDKDRHIFQIGANIIDQADSDSLPTAIHFDAFSWGGGLFPAAERVYNTLYGNENLPYITRLFIVPLEFPTEGKLSTWIQPEIWNPHQAPAAGATAPPTYFRVRSYGLAQTAYDLRFGGGGALKYHTEGAAVDYEGAEKDLGIVYFSAQSGTNSFFYNRPRPLPKSQVDTSKTAATNFYDDTTGIIYPENGTPSDPDTYKFAGISTGYAEIDTGPWIPDPKKPTKGDSGTRPWMNPGPPSQPWKTGDPPNNDWHVFLKILPSKLTVSLECSPDGVTWYPYSFVSRLDEMLSSDLYDSKRKTPFRRPEGYFGMSTLNMNGPENFYYFCRPDPRTDRFSVQLGRSGYGVVNAGRLEAGYTMERAEGKGLGVEGGLRSNEGFTYIPALDSWSGKHQLICAWAENQVSSPFGSGTNNAFYADPDGVLRVGDGINRNTSTGDGCLLYHADNASLSAEARRPVILNRPFRSVGELGYVYRDLPFKTLDLFSATSADSALLDLFTPNDEPVMSGGIAGKINPNNAPEEVLEAVMAGTQQNASVIPAVKLAGTDARMVATEIAAAVASAPLANPSDLVEGPMVSAIQAGYANGSAARSANRGNKAYTEAAVRALSGVANTRTWNLLIDVAAQSGRLNQKADGLEDFIVEGEKRYWLHVAIDRYTGDIVDQQLEAVYE